MEIGGKSGRAAPFGSGRYGCQLVLGGLAVLAQIAALGGPGAEPALAEDRPSIVQIVLDDATVEMIGPRTTPAIWRQLAGVGTTFTEAVTTSPACCPSRAAMLTGQYGHNNGVLVNFPGYPALRDRHEVLPRWLQRSGYQTIHVGEVMHGVRTHRPDWQEPGWDDWYATRFHRYDQSEWSFDGETRFFAPEPRNQTTRLINRISAKQLATARSPFFLNVAHLAPHLAVPPDDGGPCAGHARFSGPLNVPFGEVSPPRGPAYDRLDRSGRPLVIQAWGSVGERRERRMVAAYRCAVASLAAVDRGVARLLGVLRERKLLANTAVILTSDNGMIWGQHGVGPAKHVAYEESIRVPLIIRLPRHLRPSNPRVRSSARVALLDLAPTILELAGASSCRASGVCRRLDGRSLLAAARRRPRGWHERRAIGIELDSGEWICGYRAVRAPAGVYIHHQAVVLEEAFASSANPCVPGSFTEVYDARSDPAQLHNLAADPYAENALAGALAERAARIATCTGVAGREPPPPAGRAYCE